MGGVGMEWMIRKEVKDEQNQIIYGPWAIVRTFGFYSEMGNFEG